MDRAPDEENALTGTVSAGTRSTTSYAALADDSAVHSSSAGSGSPTPSSGSHQRQPFRFSTVQRSDRNFAAGVLGSNDHSLHPDLFEGDGLFRGLLWGSLWVGVGLEAARCWFIWQDLHEDGDPFNDTGAQLGSELVHFIILIMRNVVVIWYIRSQHLTRDAASASRFHWRNIFCGVALEAQSDMQMELLLLAGTGALFKWLAFDALGDDEVDGWAKGVLAVQMLNCEHQLDPPSSFCCCSTWF